MDSEIVQVLTRIEKLLKTEKNFRAYNMALSLVSTAGRVPLVENCFAIMFTNLGDTIATVNGMIIFPSLTPATSLGDSRSLSGHLMDLYKGNLNLAFQQPLGVAPLVEIVQLFYVLPYQFR
jgi:hypothetical protein